MPLGTEINLDPPDVVLDGSQLPLKGAQSSCLQEGVTQLEQRFQGEGFIPLTMY